MNDAHDARQIAAALAAPFDASEVKFKPAVVKGTRALVMHYVDARVVQDRLDEVMGIDGWQTEYHQVGPDSVECRLSLKINGQWITRSDVGSTSEQPDAGDRFKAAYSDALKRAAVQFGIGRFLYRMPNVWCDYDPVKKQILRPPQLPAPATPRSSTPANGKSSRRPQVPAVPQPAPVKDGDMVQVWVDSARDAIRQAQTLPQLASAWNAMTDEIKSHCIAAKDQRKRELARLEPSAEGE